MIVKPWEDFQTIRNRHGLEYDKGSGFHIPNYLQLVYFMKVGLFDEI